MFASPSPTIERPACAVRMAFIARIGEQVRLMELGNKCLRRQVLMAVCKTLITRNCSVMLSVSLSPRSESALFFFLPRVSQPRVKPKWCESFVCACSGSGRGSLAGSGGLQGLVPLQSASCAL